MLSLAIKPSGSTGKKSWILCLSFVLVHRGTCVTDFHRWAHFVLPLQNEEVQYIRVVKMSFSQGFLQYCMIIKVQYRAESTNRAYLRRAQSTCCSFVRKSSLKCVYRGDRKPPGRTVSYFAIWSRCLNNHFRSWCVSSHYSIVFAWMRAASPCNTPSAISSVLSLCWRRNTDFNFRQRPSVFVVGLTNDTIICSKSWSRFVLSVPPVSSDDSALGDWIQISTLHKISKESSEKQNGQCATFSSHLRV